MLSRRALGLSAAALGLGGLATARAQDPLNDDASFYWGELYLPLYLAQKAAAESGDLQAADLFAQQAAMVGDEASATAARTLSTPVPDELPLSGTPALAAIVERARDARIVILNEAHNVSGHRAFAEQVLRALRPLGFTVFAAETFNWDESAATPVQDLRVGAPFLHAHGYYTRDPVYAETVRTALALGYRLAGYEMTRSQRRLGPDAAFADRVNEREEAQARNLIANVLGADPEARVVVLCGLFHVTETPIDDTEWFASRLKRLTGLDPLTIEQSGNWPAFDPANDSAPTRAVLQRLAPTGPVAVFERSGRAFSTDPYSGRVDLSIFHPRLAPVNGRPGWLAADASRRATPVRFPAPGAPALVQAIRRSEGMGAAPSDHCLVTPDQTSAVLYLRPSDYLIRIETQGGWRLIGQLRVEADSVA